MTTEATGGSASGTTGETPPVAALGPESAPHAPATAASGAAAPIRPAFLDELSGAHYARLARCLVLSGNVDDLFPNVGAGPRYVGLDRLLREAFHNARYPTTGQAVRFLVLALRSDGLVFATDDDRQVLLDVLATLRPPNDDLADQLRTILREAARERSSSLVTLTLVAELLRLAARIRKRKIRVPPIAVTIDHADTLLPSGDVARMPPLDRESVKVFAISFATTRSGPRPRPPTCIRTSCCSWRAPLRSSISGSRPCPRSCVSMSRPPTRRPGSRSCVTASRRARAAAMDRCPTATRSRP